MTTATEVSPIESAREALVTLQARETQLVAELGQLRADLAERDQAIVDARIAGKPIGSTDREAQLQRNLRVTEQALEKLRTETIPQARIAITAREQAAVVGRMESRLADLEPDIAEMFQILDRFEALRTKVLDGLVRQQFDASTAFPDYARPNGGPPRLDARALTGVVIEHRVRRALGERAGLLDRRLCTAEYMLGFARNHLVTCRTAVAATGQRAGFTNIPESDK